MQALSLVVSVGTDHHHFDRLVRWTDSWVESQSFWVDYTVQHGASMPSRVGTNVALLPRRQLLALIRRATIVVTQGGPGSIVDARSCGRVPIVVPRLRRYDEVVDDHQVPFCELMARQGACLVATDQESLHTLLDQAVADPHQLRRPAPPSPAPATADVVARQLSQVVDQGAGWVDLSRLRAAWGRGGQVAPPTQLPRQHPAGVS